MNKIKIDRRAFGSMLVALSAGAAGAQTHETGGLPEITQQPGLVPPVPGPDGRGPKLPASQLPALHSGTFSPGPINGANAGRASQRFLAGMLAAGNIELEMHETIQEPGAEHEAVGTHGHNEIWLVRRGTASLFINDVEHSMSAGDVGLVTAGDRHWIKNIGKDQLAYFVVTIGPPEEIPS